MSKTETKFTLHFILTFSGIILILLEHFELIQKLIFGSNVTGNVL